MSSIHMNSTHGSMYKMLLRYVMVISLIWYKDRDWGNRSREGLTSTSSLTTLGPPMRVTFEPSCLG